MSDLVRKEIHDIFETKNPTKDQVKNTKGMKTDWIRILTLLFCMFVVISLKNNNKLYGWKKRDEKEIHDFRCKLGFTLHDIKMSRGESVTMKVIKTFLNKKILLEYSFLDYQIDL